MQRQPWTRALALFTGLWFTVITVGPSSTHACRSHDPRSVGAAASQQTADPHAGHGTHHAARLPNGDETDEGPADDESCDCLGLCCASAPVSFYDPPSELPVTIVATTLVPHVGDHGIMPVASDHVLPFANAPPRA